MPATEKTWRNTKLLHMVFGLSSVVMLAATLWMFAADHSREWKQYQREFFHVLEPWNLRARIYQRQEEGYDKGLEAREDVLNSQQLADPPEELLELFILELVYFNGPNGAAEARQDDGPPEGPGGMVERYASFLENVKVALDDRVVAASTAVDLANTKNDAELAEDEQQKKQFDDMVKSLEPQLDAQRQRAEDSLAQLKPERKALREQLIRDSDFDGGEQLRTRFEEFVEADEEDKAEKRAEFVQSLKDLVAKAKFNEDNLQTKLKFERANFEVARSNFELRLGAGAGKAELDRLQDILNKVQDKVDDLDAQYQAANRHRKQLDAVLKAIQAGVDAAQKAVSAYESDLDRLEKQLEASQPHPAKSLLSMPILDAFYTDPQFGVKQIWLPDLKLDRNFNQVARFDRCVTCHLGVNKTAPRTATQPGYEHEHELAEIKLATPKEQPQVPEGADPDTHTLLAAYGMGLSERGLFKENAATIEFVLRERPAAKAGLRRGDVIQTIGGAEINDRKTALRYLLERVEWGKELTLKVLRGVPHPYATHPRLELFGSDTSPHPFGPGTPRDFGCTICHDGQGNATAFKWASHTPNSLKDAQEWATEYGWFDNHHWIYPMRPTRFAESNCLKCHFEVTELDPSDRFPDPPAARLMSGYHAIRQFGCFGCHEIKGYDSPDERIGPDLRLEPNYAAAAVQLHIDPRLDNAGRWRRETTLFGHGFKQETLKDDPAFKHFYDQLQSLTGEVATDPTNRSARHKLIGLLNHDASRAKSIPGGNGYLASGRLRQLASVLADEETPGRLRKVGPSLRHLASKLGEQFVFNQVRNPQNFRPTSRMPRFFGHDYFLEVGEQYGSEEGGLSQLAETKLYEQVETVALTKYLLKVSQPFAYVDGPDKVTEKASVERGKYLFSTRGCLACHQHSDFPRATEDQGPDLSHVGTKLAGQNADDKKKGRRWLESWLRNPSHYHARTRMPVTFLDPLPVRGADGKPVDGKFTDPAADIAEFLMGSTAKDWKPEATPELGGGALAKTLRELAIEHLQGAGGYTRTQAESYLDNGIPAELAPEIKGDEIELLQSAALQNADAEKRKQILHDNMVQFVGRRTVSKYGCFGCHDVPGFEGTKPIGTGLADWGRKDTSKLAFEQIAKYIELTERGSAGYSHGHLDVYRMTDTEKAFFINSLLSHGREGFLWQKLRQPRSFDFEKTQNKGYNERLKMPQFTFSTDRAENRRLRESVMTFVLGLVAEPPPDKYVYNPAPRVKAVNEGQRLLTKYNCGGCHTLEMPKWKFSFPTDYAPYQRGPNLAKEYEFLLPHFSEQQVSQSLREDAGGMRHGFVTGTLVRKENGEIDEDQEDDDGRILRGVTLWEPAVVNGHKWPVSSSLLVPREWLKPARPPVGGELARILTDPPQDESRPEAILFEAKGKYFSNQATLPYFMAWVPPPLVGEGQKVQTNWLHGFLLDPFPIRPASVLRMPKFNMSPAEAAALANYFAARDNADYPYEFNRRARSDYLARKNHEFPGYLKDGMTLVSKAHACLDCHDMGTFRTDATIQAGPDLAGVYRRLRPEYLKDWMAKPKSRLPYTFMPDNMKKGEVKRPDEKTGATGPLIQKGTDVQQLNGVVDLLMNYDRFAEGNQKIQRPKTKAKTSGGE